MTADERHTETHHQYPSVSLVFFSLDVQIGQFWGRLSRGPVPLHLQTTIAPSCPTLLPARQARQANWPWQAGGLEFRVRQHHKPFTKTIVDHCRSL